MKIDKFCALTPGYDLMAVEQIIINALCNNQVRCSFVCVCVCAGLLLPRILLRIDHRSDAASFLFSFFFPVSMFTTHAILPAHTCACACKYMLCSK
jgi:hypothetical protein